MTERRWMAVHWTFRLAVVAEFVGHGAFGIITKAAWVPYFATVGIPEWLAWRLMPIVGTADIALGLLAMVRPTRAVLLYMAIWGFWTALLRPLTGEGSWEFLERAGNFGVPLAFLLWSGWPTSRDDWFSRIEASPPTLDGVERVTRVLRPTTAALLIGHGGIGAFMSAPDWVGYFGVAGIGPEMVAAQGLVLQVGWFEIVLGLLILARPMAALLAFAAAWKVSTELLRPLAGEPIWEFIERGGSYAAPLVLLYVAGATKEQQRYTVPRPAASGYARTAVVARPVAASFYQAPTLRPEVVALEGYGLGYGAVGGRAAPPPGVPEDPVAEPTGPVTDLRLGWMVGVVGLLALLTGLATPRSSPAAVRAEAPVDDRTAATVTMVGPAPVFVPPDGVALPAPLEAVSSPATTRPAQSLPVTEPQFAEDSRVVPTLAAPPRTTVVDPPITDLAVVLQATPSPAAVGSMTPAQPVIVPMGPVETVARFYDRLGRGDYEAVVSLWSDRMQALVPSDPRQLRARPESYQLTVRRTELVALDEGAGRAVVAVEVLEIVGQPLQRQRRYVGTWDLVRAPTGPTGWLLDQSNLSIE